jgi:hypothetical protein
VVFSTKHATRSKARRIWEWRENSYLNTLELLDAQHEILHRCANLNSSLEMRYFPSSRICWGSSSSLKNTAAFPAVCMRLINNLEI